MVFLSPKIKRLWILLACLICLGGATTLMLKALSGNIVFFMTPSQLQHPSSLHARMIRLGGMVVAGSINKNISSSHMDMTFDITDGQAATTIHYSGLVPDLFREGQSVVAIGTLNSNGTFNATDILAKHDETYMPPEVANALKRSGKWDPRFGPPPNASSWNSMISSPKDSQP